MTGRDSVYALLVSDPSDTLAALAYTIYKQHEIETYSDIEATTGQAPTQQQIDAFERAAKTPTGLAIYTRRAETLMNTFLDATLSARKAKLEAEFMTTTISHQLSAIAARQHARKGIRGWAKDVSANLTVNFLTILLIAGFVFGYRLLDGWLNHLGTQTGLTSTEAPHVRK
ncbi:hypothetical protein INH39_24600 [Massilia violaceinigra]|uniref:Uncharacterized protein n=1 Tax=Massilia violaceinigra TaxID=2045208 RepID=A0ABY4A1H8_9BURK|nr:hypothetical protein [Massilia violaceinigra]UOD28600.1 hypothetical protein INH39_24600 [Massilia violaceinigra]